MAAPSPLSRPRVWALGLLLIAGVAVFASCGGDDDPGTATEPEPEAAEPETDSSPRTRQFGSAHTW